MLLKAGLIVAVFMHMLWERLAMVYAILVPPLLLMVLLWIGASEADYTFFTRGTFFGPNAAASGSGAATSRRDLRTVARSLKRTISPQGYCVLRQRNPDLLRRCNCKRKTVPVQEWRIMPVFCCNVTSQCWVDDPVPASSTCG